MSTNDKLYDAGEKMGFKRGGHVPTPASSEFKMTTGPQADMDHGVQPAGEGCTEQDKEAGGHGKLKPKFKKGGDVKGYTRKRVGGKMCYMKGGKAYMMKGGKMCAMKGGHAAKGGHSSKPMVGK